MKKRLAAFAKKYPDLCRLEKSNVQGGVSYELAKSRLSIRFLPPYSEERRQKASEYAKKHGLNSQQGQCDNQADMRLKCQVQTDVLTVAYRLQGKYRGLWILQKCALQGLNRNSAHKIFSSIL